MADVIICPVCRGQGVVMRVTKAVIAGNTNKQEAIVCPDCQGTGQVVPGYLAKRLNEKKLQGDVKP